jgi:hypothetical protein
MSSILTSNMKQYQYPLFETNIENNNHVTNSTPPSFVTIIASCPPNEAKYIVHKNLICHYSPFFAAAFTGKFIEGETQTMRMEDVTSEIFGQLNHWLYTQTIENREDVLVLGHLWILAERCLIPTLQIQAMDLIRTSLDKLPPTSEKLKELIKLVYEAEKEHHEMLRKAIFDKCAFSPSDWLGTLIPHLPHNLLIGVTKALSKHHDVLKESDKGWTKLGNGNLKCHVTVPEPVASRSTGIIGDTSRTLVDTGYEISPPEVYKPDDDADDPRMGVWDESDDGFLYDYVPPPRPLVKTLKLKKTPAKTPAKRRFGS